jgi:hypothetical protein
VINFPSNQDSEWDISKGDYKPDPHSTNTYVKKVERSSTVKRVLGIIIYAVILGIIVYLIII